MNNQNGGLGLAFGAFVVVAALVFIVTGGSLGGKKTIEGDKDLPPVASEMTEVTLTCRATPLQSHSIHHQARRWPAADRPGRTNSAALPRSPSTRCK